MGHLRVTISRNVFASSLRSARREGQTAAAEAASHAPFCGSAKADPFQSKLTEAFQSKLNGTKENPHPNLAQNASLGWGTHVPLG